VAAIVPRIRVLFFGILPSEMSTVIFRQRAVMAFDQAWWTGCRREGGERRWGLVEGFDRSARARAKRFVMPSRSTELENVQTRMLPTFRLGRMRNAILPARSIFREGGSIVRGHSRRIAIPMIGPLSVHLGDAVRVASEPPNRRDFKPPERSLEIRRYEIKDLEGDRLLRDLFSADQAQRRAEGSTTDVSSTDFLDSLRSGAPLARFARGLGLAKTLTQPLVRWRTRTRASGTAYMESSSPRAHVGSVQMRDAPLSGYIRWRVRGRAA